MPVTIESVRVVEVPDDDADLSWLEQDYPDCTPDDAEANKQADRERLAAYHRGAWYPVGIVAEATLHVQLPGLPSGGYVATIHKVSSPGLWSVESDSGPDYKREIAAQELDTLKDILTELCVPPADIEAAFAAVDY